MGDKKLQQLRIFGYDILINRFEPKLREIIKHEILIIKYGMKLKKKQKIIFLNIQ